MVILRQVVRLEPDPFSLRDRFGVLPDGYRVRAGYGVAFRDRGYLQDVWFRFGKPNRDSLRGGGGRKDVLFLRMIG